MRVLPVLAFLASACQSRRMKETSDENTRESLASLLLAATPGFGSAARSKLVAPSQHVTVSRRTAPGMIADPNEVLSISTMLAEEGYRDSAKLLLILVAPLGAAGWALFNIAKSAFTQFKAQAIANEKTAAKNRGGEEETKRQTYKDRFTSIDSGISSSSKGGR
mmetsp:Transcript_40967/g.64953  ORF Transcript_40967/g.64953 Transcript_40967/m.64953 type:complete len:164 (+) Transcript_40967:79-570(+)